MRRFIDPQTRDAARQERMLTGFSPIRLDQGRIVRFNRDSALLHPVQLTKSYFRHAHYFSPWQPALLAVYRVLLLFVAVVLARYLDSQTVFSLLLPVLLAVCLVILVFYEFWRTAYTKIMLLERADGLDPNRVTAILEVWLPEVGLDWPEHLPAFYLVGALKAKDVNTMRGVFAVISLSSVHSNHLCAACRDVGAGSFEQKGGDDNEGI